MIIVVQIVTGTEKAVASIPSDNEAAMSAAKRQKEEPKAEEAKKEEPKGEKAKKEEPTTEGPATLTRIFTSSKREPQSRPSI